MKSKWDLHPTVENPDLEEKKGRKQLSVCPDGKEFCENPSGKKFIFDLINYGSYPDSRY